MLKKILILFIKKWEFKKIKKIRYLIIGQDHSKFILKYLPSNKAEIVSFKIINFYIIFHLFFNNKRISKLNYFIKSIQLTDPQTVVTMIDNDTDFYRLKKYFPNKKFIAIQNGYRTEPKKTYLIKKNEKLQCDVIFCFGRQNIHYYKSFIQTRVIPIGSIKNNMISEDNLRKKRIITYISEFRPNDKNKRINFYNLGQIYWKEALVSEVKLLKAVNFLCKKRDIKFYIMGRLLNKNKEINYFDSVIGKNNFNYVQRKNNFTSYNFLKNSHVIISMTSSLGYEMLSRNNRMIFFSKKFSKSKMISKYFRFGWPFVKQRKGFFYSDEINNKEILRLAKNVIDCNESKWIKKKYSYQKNIISYNYNNNLLKKELNNTL
jgi:surface carbohydrate biosynthesis protein